MTARCPACGTFAAVSDRFCEECGRQLGIQRIALPPTAAPTANSDNTRPTSLVRPAVATVQRYTGTTLTYDSEAAPACQGCGGENFDADGFCLVCGQRGPEHDRFEADLGAVALVTDRGNVHAHNEDAVAVAVLDSSNPSTPPALIIAVCDGVSTSEDPQAASGAAVRTGVDACLTALAAGSSAEDSVMAGLREAAQAVRDIGTDGRSPSCTYVGAVVQFDESGGAHLTIANVGDSRAYWLQADPEGSQRLTLDDSLAQEMVNTGAMDADSAMDSPHAHVLTRWLGADGEPEPWSDHCVRTLHARAPGVLLICSDGLWNYLPESPALAAIATADAPMPAARALVEYALAAGGKDNITVALVPVPFSEQPGEAP
ncbi:protein phosphatase 2C domain-containing protein [Nocardia sp. NBC_01388]|uniref:protein phosphatase 2C domain-containing protein n=1 Tax=Nocardia sp. NBC_01388 TaxID=2903596 RepID=UPI00324FF746